MKYLAIIAGSVLLLAVAVWGLHAYYTAFFAAAARSPAGLRGDATVVLIGLALLAVLYVVYRVVSWQTTRSAAPLIPEWHYLDFIDLILLLAALVLHPALLVLVIGQWFVRRNRRALAWVLRLVGLRPAQVREHDLAVKLLPALRPELEDTNKNEVEEKR